MAELHDIHNPKVPPYKHQEFPKLVYKEAKNGQHPHDANKVVNDEDELKAALKAGFELKPIYPEVEEVAEEEIEAPKPKGKGKKKASESEPE
jgi:hypothetical protein